MPNFAYRLRFGKRKFAGGQAGEAVDYNFKQSWLGACIDLGWKYIKKNENNVYRSKSKIIICTGDFFPFVGFYGDRVFYPEWEVSKQVTILLNTWIFFLSTFRFVPRTVTIEWPLCYIHWVHDSSSDDINCDNYGYDDNNDNNNNGNGNGNSNDDNNDNDE